MKFVFRTKGSRIERLGLGQSALLVQASLSDGRDFARGGVIETSPIELFKAPVPLVSETLIYIG